MVRLGGVASTSHMTVFKGLEELFSARGIQMDWVLYSDYDAMIDAFVSGDIALIERVLENLIENAIKYTPEGGHIRLSLVLGPGHIAARVSDTGVGIPKDQIPHIFERFYRVEKSRGEGPEGTGLGLAIARRILELHGSAIAVESKPGAGTSFSFELRTAA